MPRFPVIRASLGASALRQRIIGRVDQDANQVHARGRSAAIVIDERSAPRLATAVGEVWREVDASGASTAAVQPDSSMESRIRHAASASLIAGALILGLCGGRWQAENSGQVVAHAGPPGGWLSESPRSAHPMFGASAAAEAGTGEPTMRRTNSLTAAALATTINAAMTASALAGDPVQWRVVDGGNGHWYQLILASQPATWQGGQNYAVQRGAHLATVTTHPENMFLATYIQNNIAVPWGAGISPEGCWLGGQRVGAEWKWCTGEPWDFTGWNQTQCIVGGGNQPDSDGASMLLQIACLSDGECRWDDICIDSESSTCTRPFVLLEWSADCNSDGIVDYGQILSGSLADANTNGVPDICECATHPELGACRCAGDIVTDGTVNGADLGTLLAYWGPANSGAFSQASDINSDGRIDGSDLGVLLSNWGTCQYPGVTVPAWATLIEAVPDPAVVTDPALRTAIAATGLAWRVRDTGTGIEMLLVPPGTFQMGCSASPQSACNPMEFPVHPVTMTNAFYLGRFEVTQAQWQSKMASNPSYFQGYPDSPNRPVDGVSWNMTQAFTSATTTRLPSEAEWEYACRANTSTAFYNNSNDDSTVIDIAWCGANSGGQSHPVGQKKANRLGFHDMVGNVWEWTNDWYADYTNAAQSNPQGPASGPGKVLRGSTWFGESPSEFRSSYRGYAHPNFTDIWRGFRVARNP